VFEQPILVVNVVLLLCLIVFAGYRRRLSFSKAALLQSASVAFAITALLLSVFNPIATPELLFAFLFSLSASIVLGSVTVLNLRPSMSMPLPKGKPKRATPKAVAPTPAPPIEKPELIQVAEKLREKGGV